MEKAYCFGNFPSAITCMGTFDPDTIICGTSGGTITVSSIASGCTIAHLKRQASDAVCAVERLPWNSNLILGAYTSNCLVWDFRRFNKPMMEIDTSAKPINELVQGVTVPGTVGFRVIPARVNEDFGREEDLFAYVAQAINSACFNTQSVDMDPVAQKAPKRPHKSSMRSLEGKLYGNCNRQAILGSGYTRSPPILDKCKAKEKLNTRVARAYRNDYCTAICPLSEPSLVCLATISGQLLTLNGQCLSIAKSIKVSNDGQNRTIQLAPIGKHHVALNLDDQVHFYNLKWGACTAKVKIAERSGTAAPLRLYAPHKTDQSCGSTPTLGF
ncbi:bifunctional WD40-repeat-containing domain superfamily/WD40-YVTN repeat-like-containing domain superfamily [Babesia duncani]|uniref:Bifunctional WD40-repeat-containing domain superfamily/WD40-YVTN repeat-like-containing domain superfamily n=1 Tax=Babesia duncani TaxID=323732 RepID=A0AAD9PKT5_9APIC|nr:bifunctional WD40-repeat-containing domain superfamily/WD40-YVTN repeat-like-containing domain superfamily [Babesia duncani]